MNDPAAQGPTLAELDEEGRNEIFDRLQALARLGEAIREFLSCLPGLLCRGAGGAFQQCLQITDKAAEIVQGPFRVAAHDEAPAGTWD